MKKDQDQDVYASDEEEESISSASVSSSTDHNSFHSPKSVNNDEFDELRDRIIKKEERAVRNARIMVVLATIACAVAVSVAIFFFAKKGDTHSFELEYEGFAKGIIALVQWEVQYNFALCQQMSAVITASALLSNQTFPNFTLPTFEVSGGYVDGMGGIMSAAFAPYIKAEERGKWEAYAQDNKGWIAESARLKIVSPGHRDPLHNTIQDHEHDRRLQTEGSEIVIPKSIWRYGDDGSQIVEQSSAGQVIAPFWQSSPRDAGSVNMNLLSDPNVTKLHTAVVSTNQTILSQALQIGYLFDFLFDESEKPQKLEPNAYIMEPVYDNFTENPERIGFLLAVTPWRNLFDRQIPQGRNGVVCVVTDTCGNAFTFVLNGPKAELLGFEDLHDRNMENYGHSVPIEMYKSVVDEMCVHQLHIYPSATLQESYSTNKPAVYTSLVALAFALMSVLLVVYDIMVNRRQNKTMMSAMKTNRLVSSLFPKNIRDRMMEHEKSGGVLGDSKSAFRSGNEISRPDGTEEFKTRPIADFFPNVTVMFADIAGFTAWSSTREPFQVFELLETIYGAFDEIATRRRVFKVETVGDCYVAVAGVPEARKDHAVVMARIARDCHSKMQELSRGLEVSLGPDTADLAFRIGLHSGPVTGGVLRGRNARFQLFGDTMNTGARMESTCARGRIHISSQTADYLVAAGKSHWIKAREDRIVAKGKGELQTYWLTFDDDLTASMHSTSVEDDSDTPEIDLFSAIDEVNKKKLFLLNESVAQDVRTKKAVAAEILSAKDWRLVEWNSAVLLDRLKAVVAQRENINVKSLSANSVQVSPEVASQLQQYVVGIAAMYQNNPFHNFEHASHVTMSVTKLLSRVVASEDKQKGYINDIASDSLSHLAVVFSALIHDVDHTGVPNATLVAEGAGVAQKYDNKSVAEKNSFDISWEFFMRPEFNELRACICPRRADLVRFRDLVVNTVLATDIVDKDLKEDRNARWEKVFSETSSGAANIDHLKATIVLEYLIQASDVCHTMQHWHIYRKWNERFFQETYMAYKQGRIESNPAETWYKGELGFFDFYIIPLAKKLAECGVFGVSSDEFLTYAKDNRHEWELRGQEMVGELVEKYCKEEPLTRNLSTLDTKTSVTPKESTTVSGVVPPYVQRLSQVRSSNQGMSVVDGGKMLFL